MARYQTFVTGNKVVVVSHYAGKAVRGIAKCDPKDTFDKEVGEKLARLRCDEKIAMKRMKRASAKCDEAMSVVDRAQKKLYDMTDYFLESKQELTNIQCELKALESTL